MRICHIRVCNFKSLVGFEMSLAKFTCLVGLNGSGKSTVLQWIDFLSQLARGRIDTWLDDRSWQKEDLLWRLGTEQVIHFEVTFVDAADVPTVWRGTFPVTPRLRCEGETFTRLGDTFPTVHPQPSPTATTTTTQPPNGFPYSGLSYQGSLLAVIDESALPPWVSEVKTFLLGLRSLELLSPELMRSRPRQSGGSVGSRGEGLAAYIYEMPDEQRQRVIDRLKGAYRQLDSVQAKPLRAGWKQLSVTETFDGQTLETEARHVNDGMLRLMAVVAELESGHSFLLFDEIENGVNTELVKFLIDTLLESQHPVLVTTHSPMILNYLPDDMAKPGVVYIYKTPGGATNSVRFFTIPSMAEKLKVMGPGEVFADTNLVELADEISTAAEPA